MDKVREEPASTAVRRGGGCHRYRPGTTYPESLMVEQKSRVLVYTVQASRGPHHCNRPGGHETDGSSALQVGCPGFAAAGCVPALPALKLAS